jgi:hypothetical protein
MNLQEAGETLESIIDKFEKLLSSPKNTTDTWIEGVRMAKEAIEKTKRSLTKATEKADYMTILGAITKIYANLEILSNDSKGVPAQWQSHVDINMSELARLMSFLKAKVNK